MRAGCSSRSRSLGRYHPIHPSVLALAHGPAVVGWHLLAERVEYGFPGRGRRNNWTLPRVAAVSGAEQVPAQEHKVTVAEGVLQAGHRLGLQQGPAVAGAKDRAVAQLDHAGVLGTAKGIRVDQLGRLAPGLAAVARAYQHQVAVRVGVAGSGFT